MSKKRERFARVVGYHRALPHGVLTERLDGEAELSGQPVLEGPYPRRDRALWREAERRHKGQDDLPDPTVATIGGRRRSLEA